MRSGRPSNISKDVVGNKYNRLTVIKGYACEKWKRKRYRLDCICECGSISSHDFYAVVNGHAKSCGCLVKEWSKQLSNKYPDRKTNSTHGLTGTPVYESWCKMRSRCNNIKSDRYPYYGGRGIKVCERWDNSFENFLSDMGMPEKGMTIDRIDVNGNYEPSNCKWSTRKEQANNRRPRGTYKKDGPRIRRVKKLSDRF